jgi:hypothetical protein
MDVTNICNKCIWTTQTLGDDEGENTLQWPKWIVENPIMQMQCIQNPMKLGLN